jgi:hypothetical protein
MKTCEFHLNRKFFKYKKYTIELEVHEKPDIQSYLMQFSSTVSAAVELFSPGFTEHMSFEGTDEFVQ